MTTTHASKFPRVGRSDWSRSFGRSRRASDDPHKHILPGIGTFVIDAPRDQNMRVRQECLKYQEAHRGILRERIDSLPDIPKRCDMKSLPIVRFHDLAPAQKKEMASQISQTEDYREQNDRRESTLTNIRRLEQNLLSRKDSTSKLPPSKEELLSRSPLRNFTPVLSARPCFGFRKTKGDPTALRTEFTNLTMNIELNTPGPVVCKATEKELNSQAEYRKQLSFCLNQAVTPDAPGEGSPRRGDHRDDQSDDSDDDGDLDTCRSLVIDLPPRHVGHTSRHNLWESHMRLKELILKQGIHECKPKKSFSPSQHQRVTKNSSPYSEQKRKGYFTTHNTPRNSVISGSALGSNRQRLDNSENADGGMEDWTSMANTPVIDFGMYDRYANVKRPVSRGGSRTLQKPQACSFGTESRGLTSSPLTRIHSTFGDSPYLAQQTRGVPRS